MMNLRCRPASPADVHEYLSIPSGVAAKNGDPRQVQAVMWQRLVASGLAAAAALEDLDAPPARRVLWLSLKVFLTDRFAHYLKTEAAPSAAQRVSESLHLNPAPLLGKAALRVANSGRGITMLAVNYGTTGNGLPADEARFVRDRIADFFYYHCSGYRLQELLMEMNGPFQRDWALALGLCIRLDYAGKLENAAAKLTPEQQSWLMGATRSEAGEGSIIGSLFTYLPPRFYFRPLEQDLLLEALSGDTDEELAERMDVATITLKKRWGGIYQRVALAAPEILPSASLGEHKRGMEKRRRLLHYLHHHMEELRPVQEPVQPVDPEV